MADPITVGVVLGWASKKIIETLAGKVTEQTWLRLQGDTAHKALKQALGLALVRYGAAPMRTAFLLKTSLPITTLSPLRYGRFH